MYGMKPIHSDKRLHKGSITFMQYVACRTTYT